MRRLMKDFLADQSGATAIEYCLIACGIGLAILVVVSSVGTTLNGRIAAVNTSLK